MSWLYKQYAKLFPERAMKGFIAAQRIARLSALNRDFDDYNRMMKRSFESVAGGRSRFDLTSESRSPDSSVYDGIGKLREHIRQLEYNNGFVKGPIKRGVNNVVGRGIRFQSALMPDGPGKRLEFPKINKTMADTAVYGFERYFKKWNKQADVRLMQTFYEQQGVCEGSLRRDGEVLVIGRNSKRRDRIIPYCTEVLEADHLTTPMAEINNPKIRNGIEYDDEGVPKTYYILKVHPGETLSIAMTRSDFEELPAYFKNGLKKVIHLFDPLRRPGQSRGFSDFAAGLKDLHDLDRYMEAEKLAALEDACMTGIVKTTDPTGFASNYTDPSGSEKYDRISEFAPNMVHYLNPNEDFDIHKPSRPNDQLGEMINQLLRGPANSIDMPPEVYSQNWQGMNYSNARTVLLNFYGASWIRQGYLIEHLCTPVWENVGTWLVIKGKVQCLGFDRRKEDYLASRWIPAVYRKWIDPKKEADGKTVDMDNNVEALEDVLAEQGKDIDEHLEKIARGKVKIKALEEKYVIKMGKAEAPAPVEAEIEEVDDEEETGKTRSVLPFVQY